MAEIEVSFGTPYQSARAGNVNIPAHAAGDLLVLFVETANQALPAVSGWTQLASSPQGTGTTTTGTRLTIYTKVGNGSESSVAIGDSGNHQIAVVGAFAGKNVTVNVSNGDAGAASTSVTMPAVTTTKNNCWIINAVSNSTDTTTLQGSGWANASLTNVEEIFDYNNIAGNGGGITIVKGLLATAGNSGSTTGTLATSSAQGRITFAVYEEPNTIIEVDTKTFTLTSGNHIAKTYYNLYTLSPSAATTAVGSLSPDYDWANPTNIYTSNDVRTTAGDGQIWGNGKKSRWLIASGFGAAVPEGERLKGIEVCVEGYENTGFTINYRDIRIVRAGAAGNPEDATYTHANTSSTVVMPTSESVTTFGDEGLTTWTGLTNLSPTELNDSGFGVALYVADTGGGSSGSGTNLSPKIDHIYINLYTELDPNTTITVDTLTYNLSMVEVNVQAGEVVDADTKTFSLTLNDAIINAKTNISVDTNTHTLSFVNPDVRILTYVNVDTKTFSLSLIDANIKADEAIGIDTKTFSLLFVDANIKADEAIGIDTKTFSVMLNDATINAREIVPVDTKTFTLTRHDTAINAKTFIATDTQTYTASFIDVDVFLNEIIFPDTKSFSLNFNNTIIKVYSPATTPQVFVWGLG